MAGLVPARDAKFSFFFRDARATAWKLRGTAAAAVLPFLRLSMLGCIIGTYLAPPTDE